MWKPAKQVTFETFLSNEIYRDYVFQTIPYEEQVQKAAELLKGADHVLIGAGAGMSAAAGAQYGGKFFEDNFGEFQNVYGKGPYMQDMYSAGFYPFPDEESRWGLWSKLALVAGTDLDVTPLHKALLDALRDKDLFVLSTNADGQFEKAGLPGEKIFATQGSYNKIQCAKGCHQETYDGVPLFRQMDAVRKDGKIPTELVPKCPVCGGPMDMNLRKDGYFIQDVEWYIAEGRFSEFLSRAVEGNLVLLELGVGFNTPTIIRLPFEKLTRNHKNIRLIRLNLSEAMVPECLGDRAVGIRADMDKSIRDIVKAMTER